MSGLVSYDLFRARLGIGNCGFTLEGGIYEMFINNTGTSVKGTIVIASISVSNGVDISPANCINSIGVIYESGVSNGSLIKVIVYGKAQVLLKKGESTNKGYWCGVSDEDGRMFSLVPQSVGKQNAKKIGYSLETKRKGNNVLALVQLNIS